MEISILPNDNKMEISEKCFGVQYNETLVHQVITSYQSNLRSNSSLQKNRSQVRGGGKKPWRQKGTGRARAGDAKSPIWRGGGVTFASKTRDYTQKVNRKMYRKAICVILSELIRQERLIIVDNLDIPEPKTKLLAEKLKELNLSKALLVTDDDADNENLYLACRNIPNIYLTTQSAIDPYSLIAVSKVCITLDALKKLEGRIS